jgi:photosystem II stability/assembly factor-like uncharacterized protein
MLNTLAFALLLLITAQTPSGIVRTEQVSGTTERLVAVSAVNDNVAWASGAHGTFVRTADGGTTWTAGQVKGAERLDFRDVHAVSADTAYLLSIGNGSSSRIYKTNDGGANWTLQFTNPDTAAFFDCFDFWDPDHGIAVSDAVNDRTLLIATRDGGKHWARLPDFSLIPALAKEGSFASSGTCLRAGPGQHVWVATTKARVLHSTNLGRSWTEARLEGFTLSDSTGLTSVSFRDAKNGMAFGGYGSFPTNKLIATTEDGGKTWTMQARPPIESGIWGGQYVPGVSTPTVVVEGPKGSAYSRDNGKTWTLIDTVNYWGISIASKNAGWLVGAGGRITKLSGF